MVQELGPKPKLWRWIIRESAVDLQDVYGIQRYGIKRGLT